MDAKEQGLVDDAPEPVSGAGRDVAFWAKGVSRLTVTDVDPTAVNRNVEGRRVTSPIQGFGKMWQKTYRVRLDGVGATPAEVIRTWKAEFASFWPSDSRFFGPLTGIAPGEVAVLNLSMPGRLKLSTGVLVLYADDESFTLMTPEGHMFAGWITFSSFADAAGVVAQAQVLMRANDPLYELGLGMGGHRKEDRFWEHTLSALATQLGVGRPSVDVSAVVVDRRRQWRRMRNIRHNAAIRSGLSALGAPGRALAKPFRRGPVGSS